MHFLLTELERMCCVLYLFMVVLLPTVSCVNFNLTIIHFNDFHARYEQINNASTTCEGNNCIGGFSRLYTTIMDLKKQETNSVILNAGDNFQGTLWYIVHKWNVTQHFLNKLPLDAITLGNHEFDDGIDGLVPFLEHIQAPVVVSNIDSSLEPRINGLYNKSVIIERNGKKIGIIGVLTTTTKSTSQTENLSFENEMDSVYLEAQRLEQQGIFTNIVLSHCGYEADLEIARNSSHKISLIVGGHTDTFLYSGYPVPGPDKPSGPYPTIVQNKKGNNVLIVQASAYTKYLGNLTVTFDEIGNVVKWNGEPIFLDSTINTDPGIDAELAVWKEAVDLQGNKIVGSTVYTMLNKPCRSEECSLGNFATDAMLFNYLNTSSYSCKNPSIAMIHAGGMRAGIEEGNVTFNQLTTTFPFRDTINICDIRGEYIKKILESFIDDNHLKEPHLLQLAGLHVILNTSDPEGGRVQTLQTCCKEFNNLVCEDFIFEKDYRVLLPRFLTDTSFNPLFQKYLKNKIIGDVDLEIYVQYLSVKSPLEQTVEGRIKIVN